MHTFEGDQPEHLVEGFVVELLAAGRKLSVHVLDHVVGHLVLVADVVVDRLRPRHDRVRRRSQPPPSFSVT